jgi:hypothetical protein
VCVGKAYRKRKYLRNEGKVIVGLVKFNFKETVLKA